MLKHSSLDDVICSKNFKGFFFFFFLNYSRTAVGAFFFFKHIYVEIAELVRFFENSKIN